MGYYINKVGDKHLPNIGKAEFLIQHAKATRILSPTEWKDDLVCVVNNGLFEAAGYVYNEAEMREFKRADGRPRVWLSVPNAKDLAK